MLRIFLIIFIFKCVSGDDDSYEKFIDSLPEDEKREFLDRIARRILEDINTDNVPDKSQVEIPDDQLAVHDSYVKDIFKEESNRLQDEKKIEDSVRIEEPSGDGDNDDGNNRYIDLTLRSGKRSKRKNVDQDIQLESTSVPFNVIPVKTEYNNDTYVDVSNEELNDNSSITRQDANVTSNNYINNSSVISVQDDLIPETLNANLRKTFQYDNSLEIISSNDTKFDNNSLANDDYNITSETITPSSKEQMDNTTSDDIKIYELSANETGDLDEDVRTDAPITVVNNISTAASTIQTTITNNITNYIETTKVPQMKPENTSEIINNPFQRKGGLNINENASSIVDTNTSDINDRLIQLTPSPIDILQANNSDNDTEAVEITNNDNETRVTISSFNATAVRKNEDIETVDIINEDDNSNDNNKELKASLRSVTDELESEEDNKVLIKALDTKPGLQKEYEVYEVAADKPPFTLQNNVEINEQPHYVPIYDYAPEKAYFRPYDRFGPNVEDAEQEYSQNYNIIENIEDNMNTIKIPNKRSRFGSYNKINQREFKIQNNNYQYNKGNSKMYGFMKPVQFVNQKMYYNPYDYFDIDYNNRYNGRSFLRNGYRTKYKPFPDSDELDHPYNAIYKSETLKDHVRAIRNILYLQELFGYVPAIDRDNRKFDQETKKKRNEKVFNHRNEDIGIDYYYDRVSSKEESHKSGRGNISTVKMLKKQLNKDLIGNFQSGLNISNQKQTWGSSSDEFLNKLNDIIADENKFSSFFDALLNVTADNIRFNNEALRHYDWLKTSVNIQSAVRKLLTLAGSLQDSEHIHPNDLELLKYSMYVFKSSQVSLRDGLRGLSRNAKRGKQKKGVLPKNRNRNRIKQPLKLWKDFAKYLRIVNYDGGEQKLTILYDFEDFLQKLLFYLNEFHDAVKHVAMVTRFRDQKWFYDLKQIFFKNATKKQLGQVVLHLSLVNLLDRIEEDAVNGSDDNFREFVVNHSEAVKRTKKEFVFVLRILNELNRLYV